MLPARKQRCAMEKIDYIQAHTNMRWVRDDFVEACKQVFSEPPYYERLSHAYVREEIWRTHLSRGLIILAYQGSSIAGFGCALPFLDDSIEDVRIFFNEHGLPASMDHTWYLSELGVLEPYRGRRIAYSLVLERLLRIRMRGGIHYCLETAKEGSNSEHLYRKIGATEVGESPEEDGSRYFIGSCEEAIHTLRALI